MGQSLVLGAVPWTSQWSCLGLFRRIQVQSMEKIQLYTP
jgi:hypothetical protein